MGIQEKVQFHLLLKVETDEETVCGIEHHMNKQFTDALCVMPGHPRKCPQDRGIPMEERCRMQTTNENASVS